MTRIFAAPGRVNLIGEHTDYNDGFVLPAAINYATHVRAERRSDRQVTVFSQTLGQSYSFSLDEAGAKPRGAWSDYVQGVALVLERCGYRLCGADLRISSDIPMGAGLSSSAALEVATALALLAISGLKAPPLEIAAMCRQAEHEFAGTHCGIMDQFIALHAVAGHAIFLDCRSLAWRTVALPENIGLVICNSMVKHALAGSQYNERRAACELAARRLGVASLRDADPAALAQPGALPNGILRRARHVVREIARTEKAAEALEAGDLKTFGDLMYESHESLRLDYEVSCAELDLLVDLARQIPGVYGARMTGAGFGGCVLSLAELDCVPTFLRSVPAAYEKATGRRPEIYVCRPSGGAREIER